MTAAGTAVVLAALAATLLLRASGVSILGWDGEPSPAEPVASPAVSPPTPAPGFGFSRRIDWMAVRILSRQWTQTRKGDIELWWRNICPQGTTGYWVALRPQGETVQFACNSWQYYMWTGVEPGTHRLEFWKDRDGRVIHGSGTVRSTVPVVLHDEPTPTPASHEHEKERR